jgi:5-methylcytosine-specific restriction endonuclease McrA
MPSMRNGSWLCSEPRCPVILDHPGRCPEHSGTSWDRWRQGQRPEKSFGYGHRWRKFKQAILRERGAVCEFCGRTDVPLALHHLDHQPPTGPRGYDPANVKFACTACHVRESRRGMRRR